MGGGLDMAAVFIIGNKVCSTYGGFSLIKYVEIMRFDTTSSRPGGLYSSSDPFPNRSSQTELPTKAVNE